MGPCHRRAKGCKVEVNGARIDKVIENFDNAAECPDGAERRGAAVRVLLPVEEQRNVERSPRLHEDNSSKGGNVAAERVVERE